MTDYLKVDVYWFINKKYYKYHKHNNKH